MKFYHRFYSFLLLISIFLINTKANSGGILLPEQAAYDVQYYDLDLNIDPGTKTIDGSLLCSAEIVDQVSKFVLHLSNRYTVDSVLIRETNSSSSFIKTNFVHTNGLLEINTGGTLTSGQNLEVVVYYNGMPGNEPGIPYDSGVLWETSADGNPWIGVACQTDGADVWWPCKDHPTDEPDSMSLSFTVPEPLFVASNGTLVSSQDNGDSTTTYNWFVSTPINNYNVTFYAGKYELIEDNYESVTGELIPFKFWVLPEVYSTAVDYMNVFKTEFEFLESICGPFPFRQEKQGWAHAPYVGMEHQTIIAYGSNFTLNDKGYDYIHFHELAHEWWGNLITAKDWSDLWIHEGIATYTELLYVEELSGIERYLEVVPNARFEGFSRPLAPTENLTAADAFDNLFSYVRGSLVMHGLRHHLGDEQFFNLLKRWTYPDSTDYDNTNGRQARILSTNDMRDLAEGITGVELNAFWEVYFRQAKLPILEIERTANKAVFNWTNERADVQLDIDIPIRVDGTDYVVDMEGGEGSFDISSDKEMIVDPDEWLVMNEPIITGIEDAKSVTMDFRLQQNYPNPFNPETKIKFSIPESAVVKLTVYDNLGREVETLVNQFQNSGNYEVPFSGEDLSSGIYFYTLKAGLYQQTRKMILLK